MDNINRSYKNVSSEISLDKKVVLSRMLQELPQTYWANVEILDWLPDDDKLPIEYSFYDSSFGRVLAANTSKGICYLGLEEDKPEYVLADFKKRFRHTNPIKIETPLQKQAIDFLDGKINELLQFHLRGTSYQTKIWRKLICIPYGKVISYATLGSSPQHSRAAGTANGRNPIFWIIPCHRAVKTTGAFDHYFWGEGVKKRLLAWEFANSSV